MNSSTPTSVNTLQVKDLACRRGERLLFEHLDVELCSGELLLIEGHNGCGKTTLLKTLASLRQPDTGDILWNNTPSRKQAEAFHQQLFWLGHHNAIKGDLTAVENLRIQANLREVNVSDNEIWDALDTIGLYGYEDLPTKVLSQGQKRRVALAGFLLTTATLWILDEPFSALDVKAVDLLQSILRKHVEQGGMVILTTHQEVALMSDQIKRLQLDQLGVTNGD
jgi:heme exporter protein A